MRSPVRRARVTAAVAAVSVAGLLLAGCGSAGGGGASPVAVATSSPAGPDLRGDVVDPPIAKPAVTLTDTSGQPYDFRARTQGRLTILYFGYTNCPDECPTTMADLGIALQQVPAQVRTHTTVVFVTSDPARDTPPVLRTWLDRFDTSFVGLTGDFAQVKAMADAVGVDVETPQTDAAGKETVTHGTQLLAFSPGDGKAHDMWANGAGSAAYAHDLPLLAAGDV